jgi:hypothetical protein
MTDRQGIEIDYCPKCRGIWLDRGELDKLIERSAQAAPVMSSSQTDWRGDDRRRDDDRRYDDDDYKKKRKRSSFLGELLDF